jgi:predicted unusual protein kinase regulating ubiquinone biosynthesis (AarF/ABC1/UbiB family)
MARSRRRYSRMMNKRRTARRRTARRRTARRRTARRNNTRRKMRGGGTVERKERERKQQIIDELANVGIVITDLIAKMSKAQLLDKLNELKGEIYIKLGQTQTPRNSEQLYTQSRTLAKVILIAKDLPDVSALKRSTTRYF